MVGLNEIHNPTCRSDSNPEFPGVVLIDLLAARINVTNLYNTPQSTCMPNK